MERLILAVLCGAMVTLSYNVLGAPVALGVMTALIVRSRDWKVQR